METLIELRNVTVKFGNYTVLNDITAQFPAGRASFVIGPTGCGKSTLLKAAAGLIPPDYGEVLAGNKSYGRMSNREMREFRLFASYVFQNSALWSNMSIQQNMLLPLQTHFPTLGPEPAQRRIDAAINKVGYTESTSLRPAELSSGEQKLIGFARALVLDPMMLFLDAPFSMLDTHSAQRIQQICTEFRRAGKTMLLVTNNLEFTFELADYLCIMHEGKITNIGPLLDVVSQWPDFMESLTPALLQVLDQRRVTMGKKS